MRLEDCSPGIAEGDYTRILQDTTNVDDDTDTGEATPWDLSKLRRRLPYDYSEVDMGAFEACVGDFDDDNQVWLPDLALLLSCFGQPCPGSCCLTDLNCDGVVDISDLGIFLAHNGSICTPPVSGFVGGGGEGEGGENSTFSNGDEQLMEWLRSATPEEVLEWWFAGQPPIGDDR